MADVHVVADGLVFGYGDGPLRVPILEGASFTMPRGCVTAITGPSGCGKTTLLSLLGGLDRAERGSLEVGGHDLCGMSPRALSRYRRTNVGFVFQFFHLLPTLTARENVEAGLDPLDLPRAARRRAATRALEAVGLEDLMQRFPHELSGGQQQRVAVARAWAKAPPLLLADEPTGNLDEAQSVELLDLLVRGHGSRDDATLVLVTHDPLVADRAHQVLRLERGHVVTVEG